MTDAPTIRSLLRQAASDLDQSESARLDAELLMMHALERDRAWLYANSHTVPQTNEIDCFSALIGRRARGEPVAYLTGKQAFWTLNLNVTPDVLIPRPETELLVEVVLEQLKNLSEPMILDLGTGSGAIALALASERPDAFVLATDISSAALLVARSNAKAHGIENVRFLESDWFAAVPGEFDVIASNPPYVEAGDVHLQRGDCRFEPRIALTPGEDGMASIRTICSLAKARLKTSGMLAIEHGFEQGPATRECLDRAGYAGIGTREDLAGLDRMSFGFNT